MAIAGMPSAIASRAWATSLSTVSRSTPGIAPTGSALSVPSMTNIGHIRSSTESRLSAIIRREKAFILFRRIRVAGYSPLLILAPID